MQTCYATQATIIIRQKSNVRTKEERSELLRKAQILDVEGNYVERFFSKETLEKDKVYRLGK